MFDCGHIFPQKTLWFGEKNSIFDTQKTDSTLFHDFSASQPSSSAKNEQNITLQLWQNSGETDLVTLIHQNMSKIDCFWSFSHFFRFWGPFLELWTQNQNLLFYSSNVGWNISNDRFMPQVYKKRNFQIWLKTKLYSLQSIVPPPPPPPPPVYFLQQWNIFCTLSLSSIVSRFLSLFLSSFNALSCRCPIGFAKVLPGPSNYQASNTRGLVRKV